MDDHQEQSQEPAFLQKDGASEFVVTETKVSLLQDVEKFASENLSMVKEPKDFQLQGEHENSFTEPVVLSVQGEQQSHIDLDLPQSDHDSLQKINVCTHESKELLNISEQITQPQAEKLMCVEQFEMHLPCSKLQPGTLNQNSPMEVHDKHKELESQSKKMEQCILSKGKDKDLERQRTLQKQPETTNSEIDILGQEKQQQNVVQAQKNVEANKKSQKRPNEGNPNTKEKKPVQQQQLQGKKQKTGIVGDNHERINYLVQVSRKLVHMGQSESESTSLNERALASQAGSLAVAVGKKSLSRLSPSLKRMICKGCGTVLIYGVNAKVRKRSNRQSHLSITCLVCKTIKRFVCDPKHKLWCENEEAVM